MSITIAPPPSKPHPTGSKFPTGARKPRLTKAERAAASAEKCGSCIALCCRYFALEVDAPTEPKDFEDLRWYLLHERTQVFREGRSWFVQIFSKCRALGPDQRCTIYDKRPAICRDYENDWCDKDELTGEPEADLTFRTVEELEAYRDAWVKRYQATQRKKRKAAAKKAVATRRRRARAAKAYRGSGAPTRAAR
ncbi:MAG: YkgJ family cysteine cluster protein [Planctomycetota bacterium]